MGTKGREIVGADLKKLLKILNQAYADEWMAYYQYWVGAKIVKGPMRGPAVAELEEHAADELEHAGKLVKRMIELGGTPLLSPEDWMKAGVCGYHAPKDPAVQPILKQNIEGEQCAIEFYQKLIDMVRGKDDITYNLALEILEDEVEHEEDLQAILEDLSMMKKQL